MVVLCIQQKYFLFKIGALHGTAMLVCSLLMKSRKRLAHDVMYTSAKHASLVYDIT